MSETGVLGIVVVNFASSELLKVNLVRVSEALPDARVVVVDNYSSDGERQAVVDLAYEQGWHLVPSAVNAGFGAGMNAGVARALALGCDLVMLLNPDAHIDADSTATLCAAVAESPMTAVAPKILTGAGAVWFDGFDLYLDNGSTLATRKRSAGNLRPVEPWLNGACMVVHRQLWLTVGGYEEDFFLYWEDIDLSHRIRLAGGALKVVSDARAIHDEGGTHGEHSKRPEAKSNLYYYYNIRNRLRFAGRHLTREEQKAWIRTAPKAAYDILLRGGRRQFLHPWRPLRAAVTGTVHGLRDIRSARRQAPVRDRAF